MSKPLATKWTAHISDPQKKEEFAAAVRASAGVLGRLQTMIQQGGTNEDRKIVTDAAFDSPNFHEKLTFNLGKRAGEDRILELLSFLDP